MRPSSSTPARAAHPEAINFSWLVRLRWGAIAAQALAIGLADRLLVDLPLRPLVAVLALTIASNAGCEWWRRVRRVETRTTALVMLLDVGFLSALLYWTGGPFNPFSFLYLVNIALAAVVLPPRWTWTLVALSLACFEALFFWHVPLERVGGHGAHGHDMWLHLNGMWVAFGVTAAFIVYFTQRVTRALAARDRDLAAAQRLAERHERLASLATLAAGAAHELSTPLAIIAVAARELERELERAGPEAPVDDARLIRAQVERCRNILAHMATNAGEAAGEALVAVPIDALLREATGGLSAERPLRVAVVGESTAAPPLLAPPRALAQAVRGVVDNARRASPPGAPIDVVAARVAAGWTITVRDAGTGMAPDVLAHAGEPFFSTRAGGRGMGLGLFLARVLLERLGGRVEIESRLGTGTTVALVLPDRAAPASGAPEASPPAAVVPPRAAAGGERRG